MSRIKKWPYPGDSDIVKSRKMALAYKTTAQQWEHVLRALRDKYGTEMDDAIAAIVDDLIAAAPNTETLDKLFTEWGQTWHCPPPDRYDDDDYVDAKIGAALIQISTGTLSRSRTRGRITGVWDPDYGHRGGFKFRVGDLYKLQTDIRSRPQGHRAGTLLAKNAAGQLASPTTGEVTSNE